VDLNTTEPEIKKTVAAIIEPTGASFVDAAMMGGIPTFLHKVPILASGAGAYRFKQECESFGMNISMIGDEPGQAAAIKMFRSIFMKGMLALILEVMEASKKYHATDTVLASIAETMDKNQFMETARRVVTKGAVNPERMAIEMEGVVKTLENLSVSATMSSATRDKLLWCARFNLRERFGGAIPETLGAVLEEL
jgi:3-hydroxyisobutyrate dehydrogenase-like beta-hydroxyacid dehydrogenase